MSEVTQKYSITLAHSNICYMKHLKKLSKFLSNLVTDNHFVTPRIASNLRNKNPYDNRQQIWNIRRLCRLWHRWNFPTDVPAKKGRRNIITVVVSIFTCNLYRTIGYKSRTPEIKTGPDSMCLCAFGLFVFVLRDKNGRPSRSRVNN